MYIIDRKIILNSKEIE